MRPEQEQELAHILLVELLAYQFASPVRWIETQDVILSEHKAERIVEIGPSDTLGGMARRTLAAKYEAYDAALSLQRQILCYNKDKKEIYYDVDPVEENSAGMVATTGADESETKPAAPAITTSAPPPQVSPNVQAAQVPDEPVQAIDVVKCLVAQKLKKVASDIPTEKAIKDLVGGKSTLQNEIIGDLGKEFGSIPEKAEDLPIAELGSHFQDSFSGQLGKQSSSLIARLLSSKMPGGFNMTAVRKHLSTQWGLQSGRQDSVLLLSLTMEPSSRLSTESDAKAFFDQIVGKYSAAVGISFAAAGSAPGSSSGPATASIDPAALELFTKDQRLMFSKQMELLARYLKVDLRAGDRKFSDAQEAQSEMQKQLDLWIAEHGESYEKGIRPAFSPLKVRVYDSHWNWVRQDALSMYFDIIFGRLKLVDREIVAQCIRVMNRSNPTLLQFMRYRIDNCPVERGPTYALAKELGEQLIQNCREVLDAHPVYKDIGYPTGPHTTIDETGNITYSEVPRKDIRKLENYVMEMKAGGKITEFGGRTKVQNDLEKIYKILKQQHRLSKTDQIQIKTLYANVLRSLAMDDKHIRRDRLEKRGSRKGTTTRPSLAKAKLECIPFLHLKKKEGLAWEYSRKLTGLYLDCLEDAAKNGLSFHGKNVLMTGAGAGSIGADILQGLISGGAKVVVTTSRFSKEVTEYYQQIYSRYGGKGSQLIVVPFNQGSVQDIEHLVHYIYDSKSGLGWDLDTVIPFAAIPTNGREIDAIDSQSELGHRIMLTNVIRLLGAIKTQKVARGYETRPAQVLLPLSPNHGTFGNDGLYSESKLGLETLFNRWYSESWANYLTICGAVIGWTRGTGLMSANNTISEGLEAYGVRTFSQQEMAFNLLGLMAPAVVNLCQVEPVFADLNGGLQYLPNLQELSANIRQGLKETSEVRKAVSLEAAIEEKFFSNTKVDFPLSTKPVQPRANLKFEFPVLPKYSDLSPLADNLKGMVDLERVVVITGFAEVGPWGNSRTRWEMEAYGEFSLEGCIEMAWMMGLIRNFNGSLKGKQYSGWVDSKSGEPIDDKQVKARYEKYILEHSGIRLIEPELFGGYDPNKKELLQEIVIEEDLDPFEASKETAEEFKRRHGDKVEIFEIPESGEYSVRLRKGATLLIPKAVKFDRLVAGQIPTGWNAARYGIPEDIISQVDPVTLYVLVCVAESLLAAGVTDPYEFYKYVHLSEVGNCIGSGVGGMTALRGMYKDRLMDKPVQKDILQESFINTMSAWVNMLLLSSTGPIKTPVGACATAVESLDIGFETIVEGKAKICFVGGFDDFAEEGSYEFANMKATSNTEDEFAHGRNPRDMSRPTTTTRNGFMESQGCGVQLLMNAKTALEMGVPIYGIVALTATATDKIGRSVPAPGQGIISTAREVSPAIQSPLLDITYRKRQVELRKSQIKEWIVSEFKVVEEECAKIEEPSRREEYWKVRAEHILKEANRQEKETVFAWGNNFYRQDPQIAPLRGALATWGLTVDDINVASFHGTSTKANDKNETDALQKMLAHLGRSKGNALLGIFQKYLTGHPKGAAGAWMVNGALQVLNSGIVPGNRNADNIDEVLEKFDYVLFPNRSIQTDGIKAVSITSFGFGQKGAQALCVHPHYLFATLEEDVYNTYAAKMEARHKKAYRYLHNSLVENNLFQAKAKPPYKPEQESAVFMNPRARVSLSEDLNEYSYNEPLPNSKADMRLQTLDVLQQLSSGAEGGASKVGVDVEEIAAINIDNDTFIERNFTDAEISYCRSAPSPRASFAGRWAAKEAVFKSLGVASKGAGAPLRDIEILPDPSGAPVVKLHGDAAEAAQSAGIRSVQVSISHSKFQAISVAISSF